MKLNFCIREFLALTVLVFLGVVSCDYSKQNQDKPQTINTMGHRELTTQNREIVEDFADIFYRQKDVARAFQKYVSEEYIQHNPNILNGPKAAIEALSPMFSDPQTRFSVKRILVDGDMAMIHVHAQRDSTVLGGVVADLFRLSEGKIVEHWDILQEIPQQRKNPNTMY